MRIYIVGGGASVTPEIIEALKHEKSKGCRIFGVNNICKDLDLDYYIYLDEVAYNTHKAIIDSSKYRVFTRASCRSRPNRAEIINPIKEFKYLSNITDGVYTGATTILSGIGAVSIALNLGYTEIFLVGYDGGDYQGKGHFYHKKVDSLRYSKHNGNFEVFKRYNIINCNPQSHINTFIKRDFFETIDRDASKPDPKKRSIKFHSYYGFGDQINMRRFVLEAQKHYDNVYVVTPYPDILYHGTNIKCLPPTTKLKNQKEWTEKNQHKKNLYSQELVRYDRQLCFDYGSYIRSKKQAILYSLNEQYPICQRNDLKNIDFSFPIKDAWVKKAKLLIKDKITKEKKICVVKLPTLRAEWQNKSRNPLMKYFQRAIDIIKDHFYIISVADLRNGAEWLTEDMPKGIDMVAHNAEFDLDALVGLLAISDLTITCPSNVTHLCAVNDYPCFTIFGGHAPNYIYTDPLKPSKYGYIEPDKFCFCFENEHICNKEINPNRFDETFTLFVNTLHPEINLKQIKRILLCSRMGVEIAKTIAKTAQNSFDVVTISHLPVEDYAGGEFLESYQYVNSYEPDCKRQVMELIKKHNITHALISQIGNSQANATAAACNELGVRVAYGERFFDDRIIVDFNGLQYQPNNDIALNASNYDKNVINMPKNEREKQPVIVDSDTLCAKYGVKKENTIVFLAQLPYDEALKHTACPMIGGYDDFIKCLCERNPDSRILFKYHPKENEAKRHIRYERIYRNVIVCDENIISLYNAFDYFCSFSSTTIFEGVLKGKKFVTGGYHLCSDDRLVMQIRRPEHFTKIIQRLDVRLQIDEEYRKKHLAFITNKYTVSIKNQEIVKKLILRHKFYD